jgi:hypothetical protein
MSGLLVLTSFSIKQEYSLLGNLLRRSEQYGGIYAFGIGDFLPATIRDSPFDTTTGRTTSRLATQ